MAGFRIAGLVLCGAVAALTVLAGQGATGDPTVAIQLLAFNDFHGAIEPSDGANGRIAGQTVGGAEYLAGHLARLKATNPNTLIISAGDNIGGTPLLSSLSHDEASIEVLNGAGLQISAVGNHELDEGWWELLRIAKGGCHPVDGCQDGTPYVGASFQYLAANIILDPARADPKRLALAGITSTAPRLLFPSHVVRTIDGVRVGVVGLVLDEAPNLVSPASVRGLTFRPEAESVNEAVAAARREGATVIVVTMHQGGEPRTSDINGCEVAGGFVNLVNRLSADVDIVVSGHTHRAYNCSIDGKLVTSASSTGRVLTDIDLEISRASGRVIRKTARNVVVTRDVQRHGGTTALIEHYRPVARKIGGRVVGALGASILRGAGETSEWPLGHLIADAMLEAAAKTPGGSASFAFTNPGGIRADLVRQGSAATSAVTYAQLFEVVPFGNVVVTKTLKGSSIIDLLEEQFGVQRTRIMQVSRGLTYTYDPTRPRGQRVDRASIRIDGKPLDPTGSYRVVTNDFLWGAGDGLSALGSGTDPVTIGTDVDVLAAYVTAHSPLSPTSEVRARRAP